MKNSVLKYKTTTPFPELMNLKYAGFLLGSLFHPEDGSSVFLWNVSDLTNWHYTPEEQLFMLIVIT